MTILTLVNRHWRVTELGLGTKLKNLFNKRKIDNEFYEELEELLIEADIRAVTVMDIVDQLRDMPGIKSEDDLKEALKHILNDILIETTLVPRSECLNLYLILGVNGVGKTTTIAKLANYYQKQQGIDEPVMSAADTFRAAAIDQLKLHGERLGFRVVHQEPGSDPGAVIFDTIESCQARNNRLILADTAGRMHNKEHLVRELQKIDKIVTRKGLNGDYKKILVIDSNTGQNGLRQAETFHESIGVDAVILTKLDSSAKGGIAINICKDLNIPLAFTSYGETYDTLEPFNKTSFIEGLLN